MSAGDDVERRFGVRSAIVTVNGDIAGGRPSRPPAYRLLAEDLRAQIMSGELRPGDRLPTEPQLCARSGLSRSTIREALRLLASEHLIVTTRGVTGGSFVAQPSPAKLAETLSAGVRLMLANGELAVAEVMQVRLALDLPAAALAAERRSDALVAALRATLVEAGSERDPAGVAGRMFAFHDAIAAATGNPLYRLLCRPLYDIQPEPVTPGTVPEAYWRRMDREHTAIIDAIESGDPQAAVLASRAHLDRMADDSVAEGNVAVNGDRAAGRCLVS